MYMDNATDERVDNCSTEVNPSMSLPAELEHAGLDLQRPFTAIIDRELAYQRQLLAATVDSGNQKLQTAKTVSANENMKSAGQDADMFIQNTVQVGCQNEYLVNGQDQRQNDKISLHQKQMVITETRFPERSNWGPEHSQLPVEKTEILARFMESQAINLERESKQEARSHVHMARSRKNWHKLHTAGDCEGKIEKEGHELNKKSVHKAKRRKPPPASYGPLHAPIMSSTQKSSEFGDSLTVGSPAHVNGMKPTARRHLSQDVDEDVDNRDVVDENYQDPVAGRNNNNNNTNHITKLHKDKQDKQQNGGRKRFVSEEKFVDKFKQMSKLERKTELLKQRSRLLEEQVRLKTILAEQQLQLQMNQQEFTARTQEKNDRASAEMSLAELEAQIAQKEQQLRYERERLEKKRQEYAHKVPENKSKPACQDTAGSYNKPHSDQEVCCNSLPHQPGMPVFEAGRTQPEELLHLADGSKHKYKQPCQETREIYDGEANFRNGKNANKQADIVLLAAGETHVAEKMKDICRSPKVKDIVRKLNYNSDTESETEINPELVPHSAPAGHGGVVRTQAVSLSVTTPTVSTQIPPKIRTPQRSDASTSVSFAHIPSNKTHTTSGRQTNSTGTEMTPRKPAECAGLEARSEPSRQTTEAGRNKVSLGRSDRTYTKGHSSIMPEEETLSDVEVIKLLSEQTPVTRPQQSHTSRSLHKVLSPYEATLKKVAGTQGIQQRPVGHRQNSPALADTLSRNHFVEEDYVTCFNPLMKSTLPHPGPERDPVLELFEVKRPQRKTVSQQQCLRSVLDDKDGIGSESKLAAVNKQLDNDDDDDDGHVEDDRDSGNGREHAEVDEEVSVENVIELLNFSNREEAMPSQRKKPLDVNLCTETVADDGTDVSDEDDNHILEEVFFVRS